MAINLYYPTVNEDGSSSARDTATVVRNLMQGKSNGRFDIELTLNSATTVLSDTRLGPESSLDLMPLDANASTEAWWISAQGTETATINHANSALVRGFRVTVIG